MKRISYIIVLTLIWYGCHGKEDEVMLRDEDGGNGGGHVEQYPLDNDSSDRAARGWFNSPLIEDNWKTPGLKEKVEKILHDSILFTRVKKTGPFLKLVGRGKKAANILMSLLRYEILPKEIDKAIIISALRNIIIDRQKRGNRLSRKQENSVRQRPVKRPVKSFEITQPTDSWIMEDQPDRFVKKTKRNEDHSTEIEHIRQTENKNKDNTNKISKETIQ